MKIEKKKRKRTKLKIIKGILAHHPFLPQRITRSKFKELGSSV